MFNSQAHQFVVCGRPVSCFATFWENPLVASSGLHQDGPTVTALGNRLTSLLLSSWPAVPERAAALSILDTCDRLVVTDTESGLQVQYVIEFGLMPHVLTAIVTVILVCTESWASAVGSFGSAASTAVNSRPVSIKFTVRHLQRRTGTQHIQRHYNHHRHKHYLRRGALKLF